MKPGSIGGLTVEKIKDSADYMNILLYGLPGAGKTVLAGSADAVPQMRPVLFVDIEGGTLSLKDRFPDADVIRVKSWHDLQLVFDELYLMKHGYQTVVIDSLTETQKFSMDQIMIDVLKEHPDRDPDIPSIREWGKNIAQTRTFVRGFRDLPMHTVFTALSVADKNQKTGAVLNHPYLSGKLAMEVAGFMDVVVYMYVKTVADGELRLMLTANTEEYVAKDRTDSLPALIQSPDMTDLFDYMFNGKQIETTEKEED